MLTFTITTIIVVIVWHQVGIQAFSNVPEEEKTRDKRILLNDPSLLEQRLQQMDHTIQGMTSEIQSITSELHQTTQNLRDVTSKLHQAEAAISKLTSSITGKFTYVRWGKHGCGANATLIYTGQVGGSAYSKSGGAANPLCLVHDVTWVSNKPEGFMADIRGAEYQDHFWGTGSLDKDVPCAVCSPINGATLEQKVQSMKTELSQAEQRLQQLEQKVQSMTTELSQAEQRLQQLEQKVQSMTTELNQAKQRLLQLEQKVQSMTSKLYQAEASISKLTHSRK
ncbi:uncharacterized protein LOC134239486, partial [Saccostrea cucullata]|uniref:uncharacterized protein LOC134239486 n=1 Tax=Saccostrea cuccullata TaxID=36930 RepID=UPI002ED5E1EE